MLDPHLAVADIGVDHAAVDAPAVVPARVHQLVVALGIIEDRLDLDVAVRRLDLRVLADDPFQDVGVRRYGSHCRMISCLVSKTMIESV